MSGRCRLTTNQIASRMAVIVADSQVNSFTVNNSGTLATTQTFFSSLQCVEAVQRVERLARDRSPRNIMARP